MNTAPWYVWCALGCALGWLTGVTWLVAARLSTRERWAEATCDMHGGLVADSYEYAACKDGSVWVWNPGFEQVEEHDD